MITKRIIAIGVVILASVAIYFYWNTQNRGSLPEGIVQGNGRIEAVQVDISTKYAGRVADVLVHEGDFVEPGQIVANVEISQLQAQLHRAKAEIASAESQVAAAEAEVKMSKAQLSLAEQELNRAASLLERGHTTQESYDIRRTARDVAISTLASAVAKQTSLERGVDAATATAEEISTQIRDGVLISPVMGRVLYRLAEPGEVLGTGGKVLTVIDQDDIYMEIFLPAAQAHLVNVGSEARIKLDILDVAIPATVSFVSPESQFTPKQVETSTERDKLVFRVKVRVMPELVRQNIERVKTGLRGVAYVHLDGAPEPDWSSFLQELDLDASVMNETPDAG
ncbi:HlyD family efflux transporter periplasmic adaptor subunit [Roseobacter sp. YSTF-M11]|uniref:HlyD family efflux transporter periplasmic adaptor subunit n=1 Tax=Roseobacter insulae TaxID=2859783 RepID=A0A9X1K076_9RHOB|nr:HlyD family efflux transporter periplasmic adaptor subunit [Roseobacter insulae]MBW4706213.1 HlyD family efflux transporter periplasmic adaptor subunit [Roseobacter insulae]